MSSSRLVFSNIVRCYSLLSSSKSKANHSIISKNSRQSVRFFASKLLSLKGNLGLFLNKLKEEYDIASKKLCEGNLSDHEMDEYKSTQIKHENIVNLYNDYLEKCNDISELNRMLHDKETDSELKLLIESDIMEVSETSENLENNIIELLTPPERIDNTNTILEVTAGVGGQEAMLFAAEIFDMYTNYAMHKSWNFSPINYDISIGGGVRKASATISGFQVFSHLKFEGGVHRVQRVPKTEKSGRMHTSTATVAVLPEPSEIEININHSDLRIDTFRASGKGGQHVNKTESACRVVHLPTGMSVECQSERSLLRNKEIALKVLRSRLFEKEFVKQLTATKSSRKLQIGTSSRNEKIRTYNFPQDRITDHRIGLTCYNIHEIMNGTEEFDYLIRKLKQADKMERLLEIVESVSS
ncbi:DgyrCDS4379 [Dimorphilus gyrociliatus]|uniref:DgyrCDS4379 n=1 Tax=Dimorphilus gyrociliatus TaxID=2664684 RepID=A0A7I8VIB8_9ANNE|nr:DgyrCDS4379 [Dimorphilus gyrociliatus]